VDKPLTGAWARPRTTRRDGVRFAYATNGQGIYGIDMQTGKEGELPRYPAPDELWAMTFAEANAWRDRFGAVPFETRAARTEPLLPGHRCRAGDGGHRGEPAAHPAHAGHWDGQDFIAFQIAWKLFHSR